MGVGDDLGSYEVRSAGGTADLREYRRERRVVEEGLESKVGHQHLVHDWPADDAKRAKMAPLYIESDSTSWYLFWRQMKRDPEQVESVLGHPYLGVYTRGSLERLEQAVIDNNPKAFKNKFRFVGARTVPADPDLPGQTKGAFLPDAEFRSGNKSVATGSAPGREFAQTIMMARVSSGDYSGLRNFHDYDFNPSTPIRKLTQALLSDSEIELLERFEREYPKMEYSPHGLANNHYRNKVVSPLLPWDNRLPLGHKAKELARAQADYAKTLVTAAKAYFKELERSKPKGTDLADLREDIFVDLEQGVFQFSKAVRLDIEFARYLTPRPTGSLPRITITPSGPLDINDIFLGVEYSFRFGRQIKSREEADEDLFTAAQALAKVLNGAKVEKAESTGHGHGLAIRYRVTDERGQVWRVEWDGIQRNYRKGDPYWSRGGHIEVPSPKFAPQEPDQIAALYGAMRPLGNVPLRAAGGAHNNVDLSFLKAMPEKQGARLMANLIAVFESNRPMIEFLWQHPFRVRAAAPVDLTENLIYRLNRFDGGWDELSNLLYDNKYFNGYVTRKPGYVQLNAQNLMVDAVPESYKRSIDIKKANLEGNWFPSFGKPTPACRLGLIQSGANPAHSRFEPGKSASAFTTSTPPKNTQVCATPKENASKPCASNAQPQCAPSSKINCAPGKGVGGNRSLAF